jgi:hypothetical protein
MGFDHYFASVGLQLAHSADLAVSDPNTSSHRIRTRSIVDLGIPDQEYRR